LDFYRKQKRRVAPNSERPFEREIDRRSQGISMKTADPPDAAVERKEFVGALLRCIERMDQRSRRIWFFRVFYDFSSKDIAVHPDINLKASHVDVLLQRSRKAIRECMQSQNYDAHDMPPGTFTELWKIFRSEDITQSVE
jgi:DNA-directed RNA polymerase specialized sigma24 family protein